jgi:kumamolisin
MTNGSASVPVPRSEREPLRGATRIGPVAPEEPIVVTVLVRRREDAPPEASPRAAGGTTGERMSREVLAARSGAADDDLRRVEEFARAHSLTVLESSPARRSVILSGRTDDACAAFGVELNRYEHPAGGYRGRTGSVFVPEEIAPLVEGVFGLDNRPQARAQFRIADPAAVLASFTPVEIGSLYRFPTGATGEGECVAIIELGGGYREADLETFFQRLELSVPSVTAISVDGGQNSPTGDPNGADAEVMLDIEIVGALAGAARIAVYFAPNTDQGFIDAVTTAIHDGANAPSVLSISWGGPESSWTGQAQQALDQAFADAARLGVTVCVAAGDNGAGDGEADGRAHVDFPASSPHALACGGTHIQADATTITAETVWNSGAGGGATGGGISDTFDLPAWQDSAGVPASVNSGHHRGRGVPDVAGNADPATGYQIDVDGQQTTIGGTSAVAPLWAALIALLNEQLGTPVGYLNPILYTLTPALRALNDITTGENAVGETPGYTAGPGWDACTGFGSPNGQALMQALSSRDT